MGYGLLRTYGLWYAIPRPPSWWITIWNIRGYRFPGAWVNNNRGSTVLGYSADGSAIK
jgi:hypothetical protein